MSLVGNLEDLGLGDILQIVSLSRKSGVLSLTWGGIEGKILFRDGQVVVAVSSELNPSLGELLARKGAISPQRAEQVDKAVSSLPDAPHVKEALVNDMDVPGDQLDEAIREEIESTVFNFFGWPEGTFNFELQEIESELSSLPSPKHAFVMDPGLSPQYLAMEGTRLQDEKRREMSESPVGPPIKGGVKHPAPPADVELPKPEATLPQENNAPREAEPRSNPASSEKPVNSPRTAEVEEDFSSVAEALAYYDSQGKTKSEQKSMPVPESLDRAGQEEPEESFKSIDTGEEPSPRERAEEKAPPETGPETESGEAPHLVIVDDDPFLIESLKHHLAAKGYQVRGFEKAAGALNYIQQTVDMGIQPRVVLADLIMPDQEGTTTLGGLEVLEKTRSIRPSLPVYIMTDYENAPARQRAQELGAKFFFTKPKSSQLDEDYSSPELVNFVQVLESAVASENGAGKRAEAEEDSEDLVNLGDELRREFGEEVSPIQEQGEVVPSRGLDMLKSMISELNDPSSSGQITLLVLRFASELMNRAVIFLVAKNTLAGLGQFGLDVPGVDPQKHVRQIRIPLNHPSIFREAIQKRLPLKKPLKSNKWNDYLVETMGGQRPAEVFVAPIIAGGKIAALIYGDNVPEEKEIGDTESLEIFLAQAGLAMEKALLEMRLRESGREE